MRPVGFARTYRSDLLISGVLFLCALAVRWPHLMLLPAFSDESLEVRWGMDIAIGRRLPLTAYDAYYGPLFPYLIAAGFKCFGFMLAVPRTIIAVCGALTVAATFWLGRLIDDRWTGVLAACMAGTSPALVLYSSHYAWSNSLTPLFATLTFASLYVGVERSSSAILSLGGVLAALTIQTHPLTAVVLAGTALWLILSRRRERLSSGQLARLAAWCVVGYAPVIAANVLRPLISVRLASQRTYAFAPTLYPGEYLSRLVDLVRTFVDMLAGGLAFERVPAPPIAFVLAGGALLWIVAADWVKGKRLVACWIAATMLLLPFVVKLFIPRYLAFLLPLSFVAVASAIGRALRAISAAHPVSSHRTRRIAGTVLACAVLLVVTAYPLRVMQRYTTWALANGLSNDGYFRLRDVLRQRQACGRHLFVEEAERPLTGPSWVGLYAVDYVLALSGCEHQLLTARNTILALTDQEDAWVVLSSDTASQWPTHWTLHPEFLFGAPAGFERVPLTLYRVRRAQRP